MILAQEDHDGTMLIFDSAECLLDYGSWVKIGVIVKFDFLAFTSSSSFQRFHLGDNECSEQFGIRYSSGIYFRVQRNKSIK